MEWNLSAHCILCQLPPPFLTLESFTIHPEHAEVAKLCHVSIYDDPKIYEKKRQLAKVQSERGTPEFEVSESKDAIPKPVEGKNHTKPQLNTVSTTTNDSVATSDSQLLLKPSSPLNRSSRAKYVTVAEDQFSNGIVSCSARKRSAKEQGFTLIFPSPTKRPKKGHLDLT
jgi:hypothetical protein